MSATPLCASTSGEGPYAGLRSTDAAARRAAWEALYRDFFDDVFRVAVRSGFGHAEAEDIAQRVFMRAHDRLPDVERVHHVRAWLRGITVRVASEQRRWQRVRRLAAGLVGRTIEAAARRDDPEQDAEASRARARIDAVLAAMSPKLREVLVLTDLHGCDQAEASIALGIPENTVRSRRGRAREQFRALWERSEP